MAEDAAIRLDNLKRLWPDFSPVAAAERLWGTTSFWSDLARGKKSFGEKLARRLEDAMGWPRLSLDMPAIDPKPARRAEGLNPAPGYVRLPLLGDAGAGAGRVRNDDEVVQYLDVLDAWIRRQWSVKPAALRVLTARGSSMTGVIEDGELMFVEPCTDYRGDGIYVLSVEERLLVKRLFLRIMDKQLSIEGTDGRAPELARLADVGDRVLIHGRVLGVWALRRF